MNTPSFIFPEFWPRIGAVERVITRFRTILRANKYRNSFEHQELRALFEFMPQWWMAIDIWAYKGAWTYWMSQIAGKTWKVIAFEPQSEAIDQLRRVQTIMGWDNVRLEKSAVGVTNGLSPLYRKTHSSGMSQDASLVCNPEQKCIWLVPTTTLDHYMITQDNLWKKVNFIKIDAEGHEMRIVNWARHLIQRDHPVIVVECDGNSIGEKAQQDFFAIMESLWYDGFFFTDKGREPISDFAFSAHQRMDLPKWLSDPLYYNNFLFTPRK